MDEIIWDIELDGLIGQSVHAETLDGVYREGRISSIETRTIKCGDRELVVPIKFALNDDTSDTMDFGRLRSLEIVDADEYSS